MRKLIYFGILLLTLIIEATFFVQNRPFGVIPDLLLIVVICGALLRGSMFGIQLGIAAGVIQDILVGSFGISIIINIFVAYLVGTLEDKVVKEQILVPIFVVFFMTFVYNILYMFLSENLVFAISFFWALKVKIFPLAVSNSLLSIPIYFALHRLERKLYYY